MPEQINLSDALALIESSKSDIKTSVENKGGTIGDDLTQYSNSISNIQFNYLYVDGQNATIYPESMTEYSIKRYNAETYGYDDPDSSTVSVSVSSTAVKTEDTNIPYDSGCVVANIYTPEDPNDTSVWLDISPRTLGRADVLVHDSLGNTDVCMHTITTFSTDPSNGKVDCASYADGNAQAEINVDSNDGTPFISVGYGNTFKLYLTITYNGNDITDEAYVNSILSCGMNFYDGEWNGIDAPFKYEYDATNHCIVITPTGDYSGSSLILNEVNVNFAGHDNDNAIPVYFGYSSQNSIRVDFN